MSKMTLSFKVDPCMKKALEDIAEKEDRSLINYVITVLMQHLEQREMNWREEPEKRPDKKPKR